MFKINLPKKLRVILKLLVTVLAVYFVTTRIDFEQQARLLGMASPSYLILAIICFLTSKVISAYRLNIFLRQDGIRVPGLYNLKLYWLGMYYNILLPGDIGGDGYKIYTLSRITNNKIKDVFRPVAIDRLSGLLSMLCLTVLLAFFIPKFTGTWFYLWASAPVLIITFFIIIKRIFPQHLSSFIYTVLLSFMIQSLQIICAFFILKALHVEAGYGIYLFVFLMSSVVSIIPFTIGGAGAREITFIIASQYLGLHPETSVGTGLLFYVITLLVSMTGLYFSYKKPEIESRQEAPGLALLNG